MLTARPSNLVISREVSAAGDKLGTINEIEPNERVGTDGSVAPVPFSEAEAVRDRSPFLALIHSQLMIVLKPSSEGNLPWRDNQLSASR